MKKVISTISLVVVVFLVLLFIRLQSEVKEEVQISTDASVHSDLSGGKGVVLCFHGTGGSAQGWNKEGDDNKAFLDEMAAAGWSYVCPTSVDRTSKQWSPVNTPQNPDILAVDALLDTLGVPIGTPLVLVGHSNGGGMVSRYAIGSVRVGDIVAVQISNAGGMPKVASMPAYTIPTLFNYAECDSVINDNGPIETYNILKDRGVSVVLNKLDDVYEAGNYKNCHEFVNTGTKVLELLEV